MTSSETKMRKKASPSSSKSLNILTGLVSRYSQYSNTLRTLYEHFIFREICFARIFVKFKYLAKNFILTESPDHVLQSYIWYVHILNIWFFSDTHFGAIGESVRQNWLIKSRNQNIFEKFKLNRNLQTIPFKMMYNMSMLRHRFSNERWGGAPWTTFLSLKVCITCITVRFSSPLGPQPPRVWNRLEILINICTDDDGKLQRNKRW